MVTSSLKTPVAYLVFSSLLSLTGGNDIGRMIPLSGSLHAHNTRPCSILTVTGEKFSRCFSNSFGVIGHQYLVTAGADGLITKKPFESEIPHTECDAGFTEPYFFTSTHEEYGTRSLDVKDAIKDVAVDLIVLERGKPFLVRIFRTESTGSNLNDPVRFISYHRISIDENTGRLSSEKKTIEGDIYCNGKSRRAPRMPAHGELYRGRSVFDPVVVSNFVISSVDEAGPCAALAGLARSFAEYQKASSASPSLRKTPVEFRDRLTDKATGRSAMVRRFEYRNARKFDPGIM